MIFDGDIDDSVQNCPASLGRYIEDLLGEPLLVDGVLCREAHSRAVAGAWIVDLNQRASALRLARESREASLAMGRRFAALAAALDPNPLLYGIANLEELHHAVAFGYTFGVFGVDADISVSAFLHQNVLNIISAAQRLLPLGQMQANRIAWKLKPAILNAMAQSRTLSVTTVCSFAQVPEMASMRHSGLPTRLFIS